MLESSSSRSHTARIAAVIVGIVIALGVGAPWLLNDAPPAPEAVLAAKVAQAKMLHEAPSVGAMPLISKK